jgi:hypothetical protein
MRNDATTIGDYLDSLAPDRSAVISQLLELVRSRMPAGYREGIAYGMIWWAVPIELFSETYNGQPLGYVALAAQKNYYSLYLMGPVMDKVQLKALKDGFAAAGKKLDMGKACVRFKRIEDLPMDVIGDVIAGLTPDQLILRYERARAQM